MASTRNNLKYSHILASCNECVCEVHRGKKSKICIVTLATGKILSELYCYKRREKWRRKKVRKFSHLWLSYEWLDVC